jgi:hypothetical protein
LRCGVKYGRAFRGEFRRKIPPQDSARITLRGAKMILDRIRIGATVLASSYSP